MPQVTEEQRGALTVDSSVAPAEAAEFAISRLTPGQPINPLWQRLHAHALDDPRDARPLSTRLRQATGWSAPHTQRVLAEYRRFLYLAVRLQGRVCPSEAVDEAWHAHLLDSSRYFGDFCPRVLQYTLHHVPSRGGADEGSRHASRYRATLLAYEQVFGEAPPADIWPAPEQRFAERTRHISSRTHWALPKPAVWLRRHAGALRAWAITLSLPVLLVLGCSPARMTVSPGTSGPDFLKFYLLALVVLVAIGIVRAVRGRPASVSPVRSNGMTPVEWAYLSGGALRAVQTALASLLQRGSVTLNDGQGGLSPGELAAGGAARRTRGAVATLNRWRAHEPPPPQANAFEHAVHGQIKRGLNPEHVLKELHPAFDELHTSLYERGLLTSPARDQRARDGADWAYALAWLALLGWGGLRVAHGMQRDLPVTFLIILCVIGFMLFVLFQARLPHRQTREGRAAQQRATLGLRRSRDLGMTDPLLPMALALAGVAVLGAQAQPFQDALAPMQPKDTGGSGCGGSGCGGDGDGGGGDGGGCGGCGGGD